MQSIQLSVKLTDTCVHVVDQTIIDLLKTHMTENHRHPGSHFHETRPTGSASTTRPPVSHPAISLTLTPFPPSVTLRHAPSRPVTLRHAPSRSVTLRHAFSANVASQGLFLRARSRSVTLRHAPSRSVTLRHAPSRPVTPRHAPSHSNTLPSQSRDTHPDPQPEHYFHIC